MESHFKTNNYQGLTEIIGEHLPPFAGNNAILQLHT